MASVTDMYAMFQVATNFNQALNDWNVASVNKMNSMFVASYEYVHNFNQPLDDWNVASVTSMASMFRDATNFNQTLNDWNVASVNNMAFILLSKKLQYHLPLFLLVYDALLIVILFNEWT